MTAAISTYDDLLDKAADFMLVTEADVNIPVFIRLAEAQFEPILRVREMEKTVTYVVGSDDLTVPTDFLEARSLTLPSTGRKLTYTSVDEFRARKSSTANPCIFTVWGEELLVYPAPNADGTVNMTLDYVARLEPLSTAAPVNPILTKYPDIYLYGLLTHSAGYLKDPDMQGTWGSLFSAAITNANKANRKVVGQRLQMKPSGAPV